MQPCEHLILCLNDYCSQTTPGYPTGRITAYNMPHLIIIQHSLKCCTIEACGLTRLTNRRRSTAAFTRRHRLQVPNNLHTVSDLSRQPSNRIPPIYRHASRLPYPAIILQGFGSWASLSWRALDNNQLYSPHYHWTGYMAVQKIRSILMPRLPRSAS